MGEVVRFPLPGSRSRTTDESPARTFTRPTPRGDAFPADRVWWRRLAACLVAVVVLGSAAVFVARAGSSVAAWWPPAGLSVAMMLWSRRALQPVVLVGVFVAGGAANLLAGRDLVLAAELGLANAVEALLVAGMFGRGLVPPSLRTGGDFVRLVAAAVVGSGAAGAIAGASIAGLDPGEIWHSGRAVMASHGASILLIAPLFMCLTPRTRRWSRFEALAQPALLTVVVLLVFGARHPIPVAFLPLPFLAWGAARFGARVAAVQILAFAVIISVLSAAGRGPFNSTVVILDLAPESVTVLLQVYVVTTVLVTLPVALLSTQLTDLADRARADADVLEGVMDAATRTAIIATDRGSVVTLFNAGAENLVGWSAAEVVGRSTPALWHDWAEIEQRAEELGQPPGLGVVGASVGGDSEDSREEGPTSERRDWTWITRTGERMVVSLRVSRRYDASGRWVGWLGIGEDVTRERAVGRALERAVELERAAIDRATQLDQAKADFVSSVSHELRTPLTAILANGELLLDGDYGPVPADQRRALEAVDRNARRLAAHVEELLDFSRVESGHLELDIREVDVVEIVARVADSLGASARDAGLDLVVAGATEPARVDGDAAQLEKAVRHVIANAVKYTPAGGRVEVTVERVSAAVAVTVRDTGHGISSEELSRIFDRFHRTPAAVRSAVPGTGLGLALVRSIMAGHGGTVTASSDPGRGSTFTLTLPDAGT